MKTHSELFASLCPKPILINDWDLKRIKQQGRAMLERLYLGRYHGEEGHVRVRLLNDARGTPATALVNLVARPPRGYRVVFLNGDPLDLRRENLEHAPVPVQEAA